MRWILDFKIDDTSPCLNVGATIVAVTDDYNGATRPQGASYDIGAWEALAATITTQAVSAIDKTTATGNGTIADAGDGTITENGVVVNLVGTPTTADTKFTSVDHVGAYEAAMSALTANTHYYVRAYGITGVGTVYGSEVEFDTLALARRRSWSWAWYPWRQLPTLAAQIKPPACASAGGLGGG